jgi:Uma2 family endonuclease
MAMPVTRHWTTADVRALMREDRAWPRYELIDGELIVTPAPRNPHQLAVGELYVLLHGYLYQNGAGIAMTSPSDLELKPGTITQPDVYVVPDCAVLGTHDPEAMKEIAVSGLLLAIEVLSPSSLRTDRVVKRDFYLANGVIDYWIVDLDARIVERWQPSQATPEILRDVIEWAPAGLEPLRIDLAALFDSVEASNDTVERFIRLRGGPFRRGGLSSGDDR